MLDIAFPVIGSSLEVNLLLRCRNWLFSCHSSFFFIRTVVIHLINLIKEKNNRKFRNSSKKQKHKTESINNRFSLIGASINDRCPDQESDCCVMHN